MDILIAFGAKLVEFTVGPILHQAGYLFFYKRNLKDLDEKLSNLANARERLQHEVEQEQNKGNKIEVDVSTWLSEVDELTKQHDKTRFNPSCFNVVQRHQQSRKAKKKVLRISEMIDKGKFDKVGYPAPLPSIAVSQITGHQILESRTSKATEIKDALADPSINRVGVYGMGGVGKTRLLKDVEKLVVENQMFDHVVNVTIGQSLTVEGIQTKIGELLGLELHQAQCREARAALLQNKLIMDKKVLIVLDDVWEEVNLEDVGILCRSETSQEGCKILVTSRSHHVLTNLMYIEKPFHLNPLSEEESKIFFMALIGECEQEVEMVATEVVKECAGLPIALDVVAKALKGKRLPSWNDALRKLKNNIAVDINGVSKKVYTSLKFSYDFLGNEEIKSLFLLCTVFPDDYEISVEDLQMYAMGMGMLKDVSTWNDAGNRVCALVDDLKSSSLLLETDFGDEYVKMHDVVRDVAIYIASTEANMPILSYGYRLSEWPEKDRSGSYKAIFGVCDSFHDLPPNLEFKQLELLILNSGLRIGKETLQISDRFFEGMKELKVLVLRWMLVEKFSISFARSLQNLQTFYMSNCLIDDIDAIDHLKKLEILNLWNCPITCLPATMSGLTELKVLKVSMCRCLEVISQNVLSSMTKLENLDLWMSSFKGWGKEVLYKNKLIKNAPLAELECLPHLTCLRIHILDDMSLLDLMFLKRLELEKFSISVGSFDIHSFYVISNGSETRRLMLEIKSQSDLIERVLGRLLLRCEVLILKAAAGITNLGDHGLSQCDNGGNVTPFFHPKVSFLELQNLEILVGNDVKMLWHNNGLVAHSFSKLQAIHIKRCHNLRCIFPSNVVMSLVSLERLRVENCDFLEMIFEMENPTFKHKDGAKMVPLANLSLNKLPNMKYVWSKDPNDFLTFLNLQDVGIRDCPQLKSVFPASFINHLQQLKKLSLDGSYQIFVEDTTSKSISPQVAFSEIEERNNLKIEEGNCLKMSWHNNGLIARSFSKLQTIHIWACHNSRCIFPSNVVMSLVSLETLIVGNCDSLEMIFEMENPNFKHKNGAKMVPLAKLVLNQLPNMKYVWSKDLNDFLTFLNLQEVEIKDCPQLKSVFPASFINHLQQLKTLSLYGSYQIFEEDTTSKSISPQVLFPNMRSLKFDSITKMVRSFYFTLEMFPRLTHLELEDSLDNHMITLPSEIYQILYHIEYLKVNNSRLVQIFSNEEENDHIHKYVNLKNFALYNLPELTHIWKDNPQLTILFDNLHIIDIRRCGKLKCLVPPSTTFLNLRDLSIWHCNELMNLLSSSVAKSLVKLKNMRIWYCQGMTSILAEGAGEKENDEIGFTKLAELEVVGLPRLENFYVGKCMLKFPCLKKLIIKGCPKMKIFSHGIVCMPELRYLKIEDEEDSLEIRDDGEENGAVVLSPNHDINVIIHNIWLEKYRYDVIKQLFTQEEYMGYYDGIKQLFTQENEEEDYV